MSFHLPLQVCIPFFNLLKKLRCALVSPSELRSLQCQGLNIDAGVRFDLTGFIMWKMKEAFSGPITIVIDKELVDLYISFPYQTTLTSTWSYHLFLYFAFFLSSQGLFMQKLSVNKTIYRTKHKTVFPQFTLLMKQKQYGKITKKVGN